MITVLLAADATAAQVEIRRDRPARVRERRTATPSTGPCAAEHTAAAALSGPGASRCTPRRPARSGSLPRRSPGRYTRRWCWPDTPSSGSSTTCTMIRAAVRTRPERDGRCAHAGGPRGRHPAHAARRLLPGGGSRHGTPRSPVQRRFGDGNVDAWAERVDRPRPAGDSRCASAPPCTPFAPCRPTASSEVVEAAAGSGPCTSTSASSRPRTPRPAFYGCTPTELLDRSRRCSAPERPRCTPPTSATPTSRCSAARGHRPALPHHRARPRRRHRPGAALADAGSPLTSAPTSMR